MKDMGRLHDRQHEKQFAALLQSHIDKADAHARWQQRKWCAFWAMVGKKYKPGGVMVVGRALNGWKESNFPSSLARTPDGVRKLINRCRKSFAPDKGCPMTWVQKQWGTGTGYRTSRSPFWRMARRLAEHHGYYEPDWPSTLTWTNLMRVSPGDRGNPPEWSYYAQLPHAAKILSDEIETLRPSVAVVLTGDNWFLPFESQPGFEFQRSPAAGCKYVRAHGRLHDSTLIIADHPQGRPCDEMLAEITRFWPNRHVSTTSGRT